MNDWKQHALLKAALEKAEPSFDWAYSLHNKHEETSYSWFGEQRREHESRYIVDPSAPLDLQRLEQDADGEVTAARGFPGGLTYSGIKVGLAAANAPLLITAETDEEAIYASVAPDYEVQVLVMKEGLHAPYVAEYRETRIAPNFWKQSIGQFQPDQSTGTMLNVSDQFLEDGDYGTILRIKRATVQI